MVSDFLGSSSSNASNESDGRLAELLAEYLERHATGESITEELVHTEHPEEAIGLIPGKTRSAHNLSGD